MNYEKNYNNWRKRDYFSLFFFKYNKVISVNIKNLKPSSKSKTKQGYYKLNENNKYKGKLPIIFRSSWEQKFCIWCENNSNVELWSSESVSIKYFNPIDNKYSNYYPDFLVKMKNGDVFLIEVKPQKHFNKPKPPKRKTKKSMNSYQYDLKEYTKNLSKFDSAIKYCNSKGWKFKIVDENWFKKAK